MSKHVWLLECFIFQAAMSFFVFDWDGTNIIDDDFLGSAHLTLTEVLYLASFSQL